MNSVLTYMSIYDELRDRVKDGRLFFVPPLDLEGELLVRKLYVSPAIESLLVGPWEDAAWESRCTDLYADLHTFVAGYEIAGRMPPSTSTEAFLALLRPQTDEVWEMRSTDSYPQLRIFGRFAAMDCFVGLTWHYRSQLGDDQRLWRAAIDECKAEWRRLFNYPPHMEVDVHGYVSSKIYSV